MVDVGAIEQRSYSGNQHDVVGPNQFPQTHISFGRTGIGATGGMSTASCPCRPLRHFLLYLKDSANWANMETSVAVFLPFQRPPHAPLDALVAPVAPATGRVNTTLLSPTGSHGPLNPRIA